MTYSGQRLHRAVWVQSRVSAVFSGQAPLYPCWCSSLLLPRLSVLSMSSMDTKQQNWGWGHCCCAKPTEHAKKSQFIQTNKWKTVAFLHAETHNIVVWHQLCCTTVTHHPAIRLQQSQQIINIPSKLAFPEPSDLSSTQIYWLGNRVNSASLFFAALFCSICSLCAEQTRNKLSSPSVAPSSEAWWHWGCCSHCQCGAGADLSSDPQCWYPGSEFVTTAYPWKHLLCEHGDKCIYYFLSSALGFCLFQSSSIIYCSPRNQHLESLTD